MLKVKEKKANFTEKNGKTGKKDVEKVKRKVWLAVLCMSELFSLRSADSKHVFKCARLSLQKSDGHRVDSQYYDLLCNKMS